MEELSENTEPGTIHLCGDASRFFPVLRDELNIRLFDTGYPIDHGKMAKVLGPDVAIYGGPRVELLRTGTEQEVAAETKRIIEAVKPYGKKFVVREANNLTPGTPLGNIRAMYETVREYGVY